jgi:transposase-like protein
MSAIHCPLCNAPNVSGQGLVVIDAVALVQYRCNVCGELFFEPDKRDASPLRTTSAD